MNMHKPPENYKRGKISVLACQFRSDSRRMQTSPQECIESSIYYILSYYISYYIIRVGVWPSGLIAASLCGAPQANRPAPATCPGPRYHRPPSTITHRRLLTRQLLPVLTPIAGRRCRHRAYVSCQPIQHYSTPSQQFSAVSRLLVY